MTWPRARLVLEEVTAGVEDVRVNKVGRSTGEDADLEWHLEGRATAHWVHFPSYLWYPSQRICMCGGKKWPPTLVKVIRERLILITSSKGGFLFSVTPFGDQFILIRWLFIFTELLKRGALCMPQHRDFFLLAKLARSILVTFDFVDMQRPLFLPWQ